MSMEDAILKLAAAVDRNAAAIEKSTELMAKAVGSTAAPKAADKTAEQKTEAPKPKEPEKPKGPTREDVVKALQDFRAIEGKEAAIGILKDHGAESVSDLDPSKYQAVIDKTNGK